MQFSFVRLFAVMALWGALVTPVAAGPWAEAGDRQLRGDLELLARYGLVRGPITAWPLPWAQISARLQEENATRPLPAHVRSALYRVQAKMPDESDFGRPKLGLDARATNRAKLGRDFGDAARDEADVSASVEMNWSATSARVAVGYQGDDRGDKLSFDGSYLAFALGNWMVYGGWLDHWWGPGWSSSLIQSTNARPTPRVGLMRADTRPFETKWLRWLGPWQFNLFAGVLDDDVRVIDDPYYIGMRFSFSPIRNLDIGLSRTIMLCGDGRPCGLKAWTNALIGGFGVENPEDPSKINASNQLAGYDVRYSFALSDTLGMAIYGQMIGEDQKYGIPNKYAGLAGFSFDGPWGSDGASWRFITEYTDTVAFLTGRGRFRQFNVFYNHSRYPSGYRYHDISMGDRYDSDSRALYLSGVFTDRDGWSYRLGYQRASINVDDAGKNALSSNKERINMFQAGLDIPSEYGDLSLELWHADDRPNSPGQSKGMTGIEVGWRASF
jgi:hypothetical protein